ncbi:MAG: GNAT family N-acetyltransferase [Mameliella sp.]|nr:GNAT family N-acetyltransferase [Phaeodactylibacter sp.]
MDYQYQLYDAFSGMSPMDKSQIIRFLTDHEGENARHSIREAIEYAMKLKPSFGGFLVVARQEKQIVGVVVANRTGMEAYNPKNIFVFVTVDLNQPNCEGLVKQIVDQAVRYADGDIAMHVKSDNPALAIYQKVGFKAQYLELRLPKTSVSTAVAS